MSALITTTTYDDEAWEYEPPEPEVGFFNGAWTHLACTAEYDQGVTIESRLEGLPDARGYCNERDTLTCHDCGETTSFVGPVFVGFD